MIYEVVVVADENDADYKTRIEEIDNEEDLERLRKILFVVKAKGEKCRWNTGERIRPEMFKYHGVNCLGPKEVYPDLSEEDIEWFEEMFLPGSEYGIHTICEAYYYPKPEKIVLI